MTVYKYVHPDRVDILINGKIRFTQANALNDLFELRPYFDSLAPQSLLEQRLAEGIDLLPHLRSAYERWPASLRQQVSFNQLVEMANHALETPEGKATYLATLQWGLNLVRELTPLVRQQLTDGLTSKIGILSLTTSYDNGPMWAHYADDHRGLVVCFDEGHSWFSRKRTPQDDFFHLRDVVYVPAARGGALMDMNAQQVLLRKDPKWSYEEERRVLAPVQMADEVLSSNAEPVYLFNIPPEAITGVILGPRSSTTTRGSIQALRANDARYSHLNIWQSEISQEHGGIQLHDLKEL
jgi:hypothetical protein